LLKRFWLRAKERINRAESGNGLDIKYRPPFRIRVYLRWQRWQHSVPVFAGLLVLAVTIAYTAVAMLQWQTMERSLQVTQGANVVVSDLKLDFDIQQIHILLENIGHVPAQNASVIVNVVRFSNSLPPASAMTTREALEAWLETTMLEKTIYHFESGPLVQIPPGGYKTGLHFSLQKMSGEDTELIRTGKQRLTVVFSISYDDRFLSRQSAMFSFHYVPPPHEGWETDMYVEGPKTYDWPK
jgi:hypothetical protein